MARRKEGLKRSPFFVGTKIALANRLIPEIRERDLVNIIIELLSPRIKVCLRGLSIWNIETLCRFCNEIESDLNAVKSSIQTRSEETGRRNNVQNEKPSFVNNSGNDSRAPPFQSNNDRSPQNFNAQYRPQNVNGNNYNNNGNFSNQNRNNQGSRRPEFPAGIQGAFCKQKRPSVVQSQIFGKLIRGPVSGRTEPHQENNSRETLRNMQERENENKRMSEVRRELCNEAFF
ncbi:hypothetical protein JTB14_015269 [Gonioctena quinquepunctata]|nr:hypothetical protein JTB14_015269 [Gonioctena quinquepunctata]